MTASAADLSRQIRSGGQSARDITRAALARAAVADERDRLNIFLARTDRLAIERAARVDADPQSRENALLCGVPYALKDNIAVSGLPLTCGSRILQGYQSPYSATVVERMNAAGAVLIGKTNLDEFAMGS